MINKPDFEARYRRQHGVVAVETRIHTHTWNKILLKHLLGKYRLIVPKMLLNKISFFTAVIY